MCIQLASIVPDTTSDVLRIVVILHVDRPSRLLVGSTSRLECEARWESRIRLACVARVQR
jgi:hypothetical protein